MKYDYLFNCTGLYADKVAKTMNVDHEYEMMPFKGIYWEIKKESNLRIRRNLYPVPDLNVPFLGVHFSPNCESTNVYIGPTATPALGRENCKNWRI